MARKLRLEYPGACYHVINRGNYRRGIFEPKGAGEAFERTLFEACESYRWRLHAFVIMSNHYHLAVETSEANLSAGMQWLQGTWANRFNRYHGEKGRPFQGRFKGIHVEPGHCLAQVGHYIHLNPVRAKLVYSEWVGAYRWSSLWWFGRSDRPACLVPETVLDEAGQLSDSRAGWKSYSEYLALLEEEDPGQRQARFSEMNRGWAIGSKEFRTALIKDLKLKGAELDQLVLLGEDAGDRRQLREEEWEEHLQVIATEAKIDLQALPSRKSAPEKVLLAVAMKRTTGVQNAWLNQRLNMGTPASVTQFTRRYLMKSQSNRKRVDALLLRIKT